MEQQVSDMLKEAGINVKTAMNRFFDNEEMYFSFLHKFTEDGLMKKIKLYIEQNQVKDAFDAAHTLKGVCANLSIDSMNEVLNPMVEVLRTGSMEGLLSQYDKLDEVYKEVINIINICCR